MTKEPTITINSNSLTEAQSCTIRVAIECFASCLIEKGLGNDETGKEIAFWISQKYR